MCCNEVTDGDGKPLDQELYCKGKDPDNLRWFLQYFSEKAG